MSEQPIDRIVTAREQRESDAERTEQLQDYSTALRSIRAARGVFLLILVLSLLVHVAAYSAAWWGQVLSPVSEVQEVPGTPGTEPGAGVPSDAETITAAAPHPETAVGGASAAETEADSAAGGESTGSGGMWSYSLRLVLPLTEFLGQVSCGLLTLSFLIAVLVCLSGGLGGVRGSVSAFFWMLVLLALLFPWGRWLGGAPDAEVVQIPGVYYTFSELADLPTGFTRVTDHVLHYLRYLVYPVLALLIAFTGDRRFSRGYRLVQRHLESRLNIKKI